MLRGERDHRRGPAKRRRHCRAVEIVGADDAGGRALLDVAVAVDTAWQDQTPTRIDLTGAWSQILAEGRQTPSLMPMSQAVVSAAVATVPLRITRSNSLIPVSSFWSSNDGGSDATLERTRGCGKGPQ